MNSSSKVIDLLLPFSISVFVAGKHSKHCSKLLDLLCKSLLRTWPSLEIADKATTTVRLQSMPEVRSKLPHNLLVY